MIEAIIIDDEKKCISLLQKMMSTSFPEIEIIATTINSIDGIQLIMKHKPQLVFLDIEMPNKNGFDVIEATKHIGYTVIFTTAYQQHAIKAIKFSAFDYLLKPIDADELHDAISRFKAKQSHQQNEKQITALLENIKSNANTFNRLSLSTSEGIIFLNIDDIIFCEASGGYTFFHTKAGEKIITSKTMKEYEDLLQSHPFFRIHYTYLVNLTYIKRYIKGDGGYVVLTNNAELPVSKRRKDEFMKCINL